MLKPLNSSAATSAEADKDCHLVFDIDGVILDWVTAFMTWVNDTHRIRSSVMPEEIRAFNLAGYFSHHRTFPERKFIHLVEEFSKSEGFREIESFRGAADFLEDANEAGLKIHAVTACGGAEAEASRRYCLRRQVFWRDEWPLHALPLGASKKEVLSQFPAERTLFIDDLYKNVAGAREAGIRAVWHKSMHGTLYEDMDEHLLSELYTSSWDDLRCEVHSFLLKISPAMADKYDGGLLRAEARHAEETYGWL
ncbi:HAD family hydrolase [Acetobacter persici]|uniref:Uncharacterized protein n=1 Tax=Acetobacter persici TaxID=1076596 RepID=A0A1U9LJ08_9PROT|nr:hypothetical protein [Acetobacter persici]AQT06443.1 hypothetical protein A0U91_15630 [Acetobacter persici]